MTEDTKSLPVTPDSAPKSGGGGYGERLARLEEKVNHLATKEDVAKLEAKIKVNHLATKEDIANLRTWILGGVITGMIIAVGITVTILKLFA